MSKKKKSIKTATSSKTIKKTAQDKFPKEFPFWARLKIEKRRTTLVIDESEVLNKKTKKIEEGFVHREATHTKNKQYDEISPNPDKSDFMPMYLKRPKIKPKKLFMPHNKELDMPDHLKKRYEKNNKKK